MKQIISIILLLFIAASIEAYRSRWYELESYTFEQFKREYNRKYVNEEEEVFRMKVFNQNLDRIKMNNKDETRTWKEGVNSLTDLTHEEFSTRLGLRRDMLYSSKFSSKQAKSSSKYNNIDISKLPEAIDWRNYQILTAVKDQGQCGSCWTFGTAETVEAYWALATGELSDLSEQQILDCTPNPDQCGGTGGCEGGTVELAYARIQAMGGISTEWTYPYQSYMGSNFQCHFANNVTQNAIVNLDGFEVLPTNQYDPVLHAVSSIGPLAVAVDASAWQFYESGVFNGCNQTNPTIDHAVQLIGYGKDEKHGAFWLVRNSWSPTWGESGYIRLTQRATPACGIDLNPSDGEGCKNGPPTVEVCGTCGILFDVSFPWIASNSTK